MKLENLSDEQLDQMVLQKMQAQKPQAQPAQQDLSQLSDLELDRMVLQKMQKDFDAQNAPKEGIGQAALESFGKGATLGYLPQIQAAAEPLLEKAWSSFSGQKSPEQIDKELEAQGFKIEQPESTYLSRRDENIKRQEQQAQDFPVATTLGEIGGGLTTGLATMGLGGAPAASAIGKIGQAVGSGATYGFLMNPGDVEGKVDFAQLDKRIGNAIDGAIMGGAFSAGTQVLGKAAQKAKQSSQKLKRFAELKALKAGGSMLKDFRRQMGQRKERVLGREMLESGLVNYGDDIQSIAQKAKAATEEAGKMIGEIYDNADNFLIKTDIQQMPINKRLDFFKSGNVKQLARRQKRRILKEITGVGSTNIKSRIGTALDEIADAGDNVSLRKMQELRQSVDEMIDFGKKNAELSGLQRELKGLRNEMQDMIKTRLGLLDEIYGGERLTAFNKANQKFSRFKEIYDVAADKVAREEANAAFGLRERISSGAGAAVGATVAGPVGAAIGTLAGGITTKLARQYGTAITAKAADRVARILERDPAKLGKYSKKIIDALQKNPKAYVKQIQILRNDPEFIRTINKGERE